MNVNISYTDLIGYAGAILIFFTFYMKTMIPLRTIAICSNIIMILYGFSLKIYPVFILHSVLLPLNISMLIQMKKLIESVREASKGEISMKWLLPYMKKETYGNGEYIFKIQEKAEYLFFIQKGKVYFPELGTEVNEGELIGEIGIFSPSRERTASAKCSGDTIAYSVPYDKVLQLYYQNPKFGFLLIQLINKRLLQDEQRRNQTG
jgi:CRP/FNR family transcriptional regulator, cyclic AMP receptor protein